MNKFVSFHPGGAFYAFPSIESTRLSLQVFAEQLLYLETYSAYY
nr:hypothetical protein [Bacillus sp. BPN334]